MSTLCVIVTLQVDSYDSLDNISIVKKKNTKKKNVGYIFYASILLHFFFLLSKCSFLPQHISPVDIFFSSFPSFLPHLDFLNNGN